MTKATVCRYIGNASETSKFQFRIMIDKVVYNVVFKDGYPQAIENMSHYRMPFDERSEIPEDIIEECCRQVELWFDNNEHNAWWRE